MNKDILYFIRHDFPDHGKTYYCPGCAELLGLLEFYPALKQRLEIRWVDFARPRQELVELLGEENQDCPVLVLQAVPANPPAHLKIQHTHGRAFVAGAREIGEYLAHAHGIGQPH